MPGKSVIVIGAGLGGLLCGKILSQHGFQVTILEQGAQAGGALQSFVREGIRFDTGFHSVGGLGPGEPLERIFRPLGLMDLPWMPMEPDELEGCALPFLRLSSRTEDEQNHVLEPYRMSTWRLAGGGKTLVDALSAGQDIQLRKRVSVLEKGGVTCVDGSRFAADLIVSDIHPATTMRMLRDTLRPAYRNRMEQLENGPGIFTVYAKLRPGVLEYLNRSIFIGDKVMVHFGEPAPDGSARSLDLLAFETAFTDQPVIPGSDQSVMPGYDRASLAESLIRIAAQRLPGLPEAIERFWTSTPQTWERYTGTPGGSAYGIVKHDPSDYISPKTPLPWLYLTGQNLGLHGVLGTSVTAFNTCKSILS